MGISTLKIAGVGAIILVATACEQPNAMISDERILEIANANPGMTDRCLEQLRFGGVEAWPREVEQCFEMGPRQRFQGLYRRGFELSRFCPAPAASCPRYGSEDMIWLVFGDQVQLPQKLTEGLFEIGFDGRQTRVEGNHGHLNDYANVAVVDDVISLKLLKAGEERATPD